MITEKGIRTRTAIVDAAAELFAKENISKVSVSEIAANAGIAKGTFYAYFESKDDLAWTILGQEIKTFYGLFEDLEHRGYNPQVIDSFVDVIIEFVQSNKVKLKLVHDVKFYSYLGKDRIQAKYYDEFGLIDPFCRWLEKGKAEGKLNYLDTRFTAYFMMNVVDEMVDEILLYELPYSVNELSENLKHILKKVLEVQDGA